VGAGQQGVRDTRDFLPDRADFSCDEEEAPGSMKGSSPLSNNCCGALSFPLHSAPLIGLAVSQESPTKGCMEKGRESREPIGMECMGGSCSCVHFPL